MWHTYATQVKQCANVTHARCPTHAHTHNLCILQIQSNLIVILETKIMVGVTGFEPATPCTPCKYSTRLSYTPTTRFIIYHNEIKNNAFLYWNTCILPHTTQQCIIKMSGHNLTIKPKETKMSKHDDKQCKCKHCGNVQPTNCDKKSGGEKKK